MSGTDPVRLGLVASFNRPGANVTGVTMFHSQLWPKRLELLRELAPKADVVALVVNANMPEGETQVKDVSAAARAIGQQLVILDAPDERAIDTCWPGAGMNARMLGIICALLAARRAPRNQ